MNDQPKVSVIIPVYNTERYLRQCLDSVTKQTLHDIEIICVDDGSTDHSLKILEDYAAGDSRITILTQKNLYAGVARNRGMEIAQGEYFVFWDSDDYFDLTTLEKMYSQAQNIDADIVMCGVKIYYQNTGETRAAPWMLDKQFLPKQQPFSRMDIPFTIFKLTSPAPWSKMFRREFLKEVGIEFQATRNSNDLFFTTMAFALAERIGYVDELLIYYRREHGNNLQALKSSSPMDFYNALCAVREELKKRGLYQVLGQSFIEMARSSCEFNFKTISEDALSSDKRNKIIDEFTGNIPKVSIIVPVYNVEKYLADCIDSLISQTMQEIEIICVDDNSQDGSYNILKQYAAKDPRITLLHNEENRGTLFARKNGVMNSRGEFIMFVDSDDHLAPNACQTAYELIVGSDVDILQFTARVENLSGSNSAGEWLEKNLQVQNRIIKGIEILNAVYIQRTIPTCLYAKIYSGELCRRAVCCIPDIHSFIGEDIFSFFYIAAFSRVYKSVKTEPLYSYLYGAGVSNQNIMNCDKFENYCKMANLVPYLFDFARDYISEKYEETVKNISYASKRMLEDCCRIYSNRLNPEDKERGAELLVRYWWRIPGSEGLLKQAVGLSIKEYMNRYHKSPIYIHENTAYALTGKQPKISIVIPVYNVESYLRECLESVVHQTLQEIEIICVNDGSYDRSLEILEEYAERDHRITVISRENSGMSGARNIGFEYVKGEYTYFLDADDYIASDAMERLYNTAREENAEIIYFGANSIFENSRLEKAHSDFKEYYHRDSKLSGNFMRGPILFYRMIDAHLFRCSVPLQFIRTDLLSRTHLRFREGIIHEDELFSPILLLNAECAGCITDNYYRRRVRDNSIMTSTSSEDEIRHFVGYFVAAMGLWSALLTQEKNDVVGKNALLIHTKNIYAASIRRYGNIPAKNLNNVESALPEEYRFIFEKIGFGKNTSTDKIAQLAPGSGKEAALLAKIAQQDSEIRGMCKSWTYRIGRFITFVPRKVRGGIRCYKEHGMRYTLRRGKEKFGGLRRR